MPVENTYPSDDLLQHNLNSLDSHGLLEVVIFTVVRGIVNKQSLAHARVKEWLHPSDQISAINNSHSGCEKPCQADPSSAGSSGDM
jgi:hypothetical protein